MATGCEPPKARGLFEDPDLPITINPDGSFENAAVMDGDDYLYGGPARDIGGGRVGQVIMVAGGCTNVQRLLVVDCTTNSAIAVHGIPVREVDIAAFDGFPYQESARAVQPPYGPLALTPATTVAEVAALAAREGWTVERDVPAWAAARGPRNAFDPFIGCRIFYPDPVGATR
jgi:hypothetical protein